MMIVVHTNYPLLVISVFSALLHYCLAQPCVKSTDMRNTVVNKGDSSSFPDLYPDDNVQWQVAPSNQPFESEKYITDFGGPVQPPYNGIYTVDNAKLTILNATATPDGNTDPTAGLYIAKYPTEGCSAAAGLTVVEIPPTCGYDVSIPSTPKLTCSITFANYVQQQIVPIINWVDSSGTVVQTETPERQTLDQSNLGLQTSTSTFTVPNGDSSSYACVVTFSAPTEFQPDFIATNAPDYNASCLVSLPTTTAASTTTKILTSTATTTAAATTTTTTPTTPLDTTTTKPLTSTATTTAAATSTATAQNPTTTTLVATTAKLLTSIAATTMAATSTIAKSNPTTVITQASAMSNAPSTGISQLSDKPTTATIAPTNPATASVAATPASGTATAITGTAPIQSTNPPISNIAVTPANTPIAATQLQTETVAPPASTTTSSTISPPVSPVSSSMSSSSSGSTTTSASQPSDEPDTDDQAQTLKIVLGLVLGSLLATALVSACWCYCCFFPLGVGARGAKQTQRILLVRRIFYFWRREPPVQRIHYYPVYRRPQVVHEDHFRYPALRKTFHWREPSENGVFWRWDPTANDAYSRRGF